MSTPAELRMERQIEQLRKSTEAGLDRIYNDMAEIKRDVQIMHKDAIPHRVQTLERWREGFGARIWTFMIGCGISAVGAWVAILFGSVTD